MRASLQRRTLVSSVVLPVIAALSAVSFLAAAPAYAAERSRPVLTGYEVIGHRGYPGPTVTENTLEAFDNAVAHGATAVELDVQLTEDRRFVVMHDQGLGRTTTCTGEVRLRTLRWIRSRCLGEQGGELIPRLVDALRWAAGEEVRLLIEVKRPADLWRQRDFDRLTAAVHRHGLADRSRYLSFLRRHLLRIDRADPGAEIHAIARTPDDVPEQRLWADAIHVWTRDLTSETVASLHADGIAVIGRAPNTPEDWPVLREVGVDGVVVDLLSEHVAWRGA